jgi:nicotinamidase-related amidase
MTTLTNRPNKALVVIDVQNGVVWDAYDRERIVANIAKLVTDARAHNVPVVWVQHSDEEMPIGSAYWQLVPELIPAEGEARVEKLYRNSFEATNLEEALAHLGVGELIVCGSQTNNCVRHTIHGALDRGYDVKLVEDAHTTSDFEWEHGVITALSIIDEQNANCLKFGLPGRSCDLVSTSEAFN